MVFLSIEFAVFFLVTCIAYFSVSMRLRWVVLLAASYFFYLRYDWRLVVFLLATTVTVYLAARLFDRINETQKDTFREKSEEWLSENKKKYQAKFRVQKRRVLILTIIFNLGILAFFKYSGWLSFLIDPFLSATGLLGLKLLVPLGISYYTFQVVGYLIDVFYGKVQAEKSIFKFALFTSFFPQLLQGPISRFDQLQPQLVEGHKFEYPRMKDGIILMVWGAFKVLCISVPAMVVFSNLITSSFGIDIFVGMVCFLVYMYASFSGGIDIARGAAQVLGVDMAQNFRRPFFATGVGDFWRRWHITLGAWMKDYVFFPVSLSKPYSKVNKAFRKRWHNNFGRNMPATLVMFFVFFLVGIWHGLELRWIFYGLYMGFFVAVGVFMQEPLRNWGKKHPRLTKRNRLLYVLAVIGTFLIILVGMFNIAAPNPAASFELFVGMFNTDGIGSFGTADFFERAGISVFNAMSLLASCLVLFAVSFMQERGIKIRESLARSNDAVRFLVYSFFIFAIVLFQMWDNVEEVVFFYEQF